MVFAARQRNKRTQPPVEDFCHLDRDLDVGIVGGDVFCLQSMLQRRGHSNERPTGVFTDETSDGVKAWAKTHGWNTTTGRVDLDTRRVYGETYGYATTTSGRLVNDTPDGMNAKGLSCVDVCAELDASKETGTQFCRTKCATDASGRDDGFACRAACQEAYSGACDRAFPATANGENTEKFIECLRKSEMECGKACARWPL